MKTISIPPADRDEELNRKNIKFEREMRKIHEGILHASPKKRVHEAALERLRGPGPFDDSIEYRLAELKHLESEPEHRRTGGRRQRNRRTGLDQLMSAGPWGIAAKVGLQRGGA